MLRKLTEEDKQEIRKRAALGDGQKLLAAVFKVSQTTIRKILGKGKK